MAASYFPRSDAELLVWLGNLQNVLPTEAKALAVAAAEIKDALDGAKTLAAAVQTDDEKRVEWQAAVARTAELKQVVLPEIQRVIDRLRTAPSFTEEHAKALMAVPLRPQTVR